MDQSEKILVTIQHGVSFFDIASIIISLCMLIASIIGVVGLFNLKKQQREACFGFYLNMMTHLELFQSFISSKSGMPSWIRILGYDKSTRLSDENKGNLSKAQNAAKNARSFLQFLQTTSNQVPPSSKKSDIKEWNRNLNVLRKSLIELSIWEETNNVYDERWGCNNIDTTYNELIASVNALIASIKNKIDK